MNKQEQNQNADGAANKNRVTWQTITETMADPGFTPEQLPELWRQALKPGETAMPEKLRGRWRHGIDVMYQRCETYPQHTKLMSVIDGMPAEASGGANWFAIQAHDLLRQATPLQLQEALEHERQIHPTGRRVVSSHILTWAVIEQLTGPVIEQLSWNSGVASWVSKPGTGPTFRDRWQHIGEYIQNHLLDGNKDAWAVFYGIIDTGSNIGDAAELAKTIEQQTQPFPKKA